MNLKKLIKSLLVCGAMVIGTTPTPVFAADETDATVSVTKQLEFSEGLAIPDMIFEFDVTPETADAPYASIAPVSMKANDTTSEENSKQVISKTSTVTFNKDGKTGGNAFAHAGEYIYKISEVNGGLENVTYSTDTYKLHVLVANKADGGLYIKNAVVSKNDATDKNDAITFVNSYSKTGSLTVSKTTTGDLADKTKKFDFTIQFFTNGNTFTCSFNGVNKEISDNQEIEFQLKDKESLSITDIPVGTRYAVTEKGAADGYKPSVSVVENGVNTITNKTTENEADSISSADEGESNLVGENENKVDFVNDYTSTTPTGIIMNNMPLIMIAVIGMAGCAMLIVLKKKRME